LINTDIIIVTEREREREMNYKLAMSFREAMEDCRTVGDSSAREETKT
jgi:hypothetical protein